MAERVLTTLRVAKIEFSEPITAKADLATAVWTEQPLTLRDDAVDIVEADPTAVETYSHENDSPEDYQLTGVGITAQGSFINATFAQMAAIMGGSVTGVGDELMYEHSSVKKTLHTAIRYTLKAGGFFIIPNSKGSVQLNANVGKDGKMKHPFKFRVLAQPGWETDFIII